jgi:hypothetical protein
MCLKRQFRVINGQIEQILRPNHNVHSENGITRNIGHVIDFLLKAGGTDGCSAVAKKAGPFA